MGGTFKHSDLVVDDKFWASGFVASLLAVAVFEASFIDGLVTVKSTQRLDEGGLLLSVLGSWAERGPARHGRRTPKVSVLAAVGDRPSWHSPFLSLFFFLRWLNCNLRRVMMQRFFSGVKLRLCKEWPSRGPALAKDCECPSPDPSGPLGLRACTTPNNLFPRPSPDSLGKTLWGSEQPFSLYQPSISIRMSTKCRR